MGGNGNQARRKVTDNFDNKVAVPASSPLICYAAAYLQNTMKIYIASKTKHAPKWIDLRNHGLEINSTWIDEAGEGESKSLSDLAFRCIKEAVAADWVILYCEDGDFLKGALLEVGAALGAGKPILCVGKCDSISPTFQQHPLWFDVDSIETALKYVRELKRKAA